jgi:Holliday junction resolvase RusA-like endonuclease
MSALMFFVDGHSQTAGSKRAVPILKGGQRIGTRVIEDGSAQNREAKRTWREDLRTVARDAMLEQAWEREHGAVVCEFVFYRQRPAGHYGTGRNARLLKPSAPMWPTGRPDALKLARAAEDALTGTVWADDAQIVVGLNVKAYTCRFEGREGVAVTVRPATVADLMRHAAPGAEAPLERLPLDRAVG